MVAQFKQHYQTFLTFLKNNLRLVCLSVLIIGLAISVFFPRAFANLWLTHDQQAYIYFKLGKYDKAAQYFTDGHWQAYSLYGAEKFDLAATLYGQLDHPDDQLSKANALAHARRYVKARKSYNEIIKLNPNHKAALHNRNMMQVLIDDVDRMSASQQAEEGDSSQELGDNAQTGEGVERKDSKQLQVEQLSAEALLNNPELHKMWLSQVQKNPARFLSIKFHMLEAQKNNNKAVKPYEQ